MRSTRPLCLALILLCLAPGPAAAVSIGRDGFEVELNDVGLLLSVPATGVVSVDGPLVSLASGVEEWFGVSYVTPAGSTAIGGSGSSPDWAERTPVEIVSVSSAPDSASIVSRGGDMELRSDISFDEFGPHLIVTVTLTNRGDAVMKDVIYTREWRAAAGAGWTFPWDLPGLALAPDSIARRVWMTDDLAPGASRGLTFSFVRPGTQILDGPVPLALFRNADFPTGVPIGATNGISWGDYDADGWIDIFACASGNLWHNLGGLTWELGADLDGVLPATGRRYGSAFGDYDNDGLPDIGTEPRDGFGGDENMHLLQNLGPGPLFLDIASDRMLMDVQPFGDSETICFGDVDGDTNLDLFLPVYPPWAGGGRTPGNWFLYNQGPTGPAGAYRFTELSGPAGLDNPPPASARPEGAQFLDVDDDGDMDLYSNGTLYQSHSTRGVPLFEPMTEAASGIGLSTALDEGAMFFDYDLDGDYNLFIVYTREGVRLWESYGDGMFFGAETAIIDSRLSGLDLGMSAEDWDNDGDMDFTTRSVFRQNRLMEDRARHFTVASHSIPASHLTSATPAWGDWDKDGDLDCALGDWLDTGNFYENTLYGTSTPAAARRHLRVKPVRNSSAVPAGLETEYAAQVELHLLTGADGYRRKKFTSSAGGYINQNEYALHFALPADPDADPEEDLHFDVTVDFPNLPSDGLWRVDKHINPALADIDLADLADREIKVYRCGQVVKDGVRYDPPPAASPLLVTTTGGLALATATVPLGAPVPAPDTNWYVGLAFDTLGATDSIRVKEILLDGQLASGAGCGPPDFNMALWDVTLPGSPSIVRDSSVEEVTSVRNRRTRFRTDLVLPPGRSYRLVARVRELRATPITGPVDAGPVHVLGGLSFRDAAPCGGAGVAAAPVLSDRVSLAIRFSPSIAGELSDPIGNRLLMVKRPAAAELSWPAVVGVAAYDVRRCDARASDCTPSFYVEAPGSPYSDSAVSGSPGEHFWYKVEPANDCGR